MTTTLARLTISRRMALIGVAAALLTGVLLDANIRAARAHQWATYHWDKGGSQIAIYSYNTANNWQAAENARIDGWNKIGILYNYAVNYHTDISVFDGYYGNTGWVGLASIETAYWDARCSCYAHIGHAHSRYNMSYPMSQADIQGIFCQEIAHGWGLGHSNSGDCMGKTYYNQINYYGAHNSLDFFNMYRYH